jgi:uncharacterized membrane-anchored protein YitT (DUF2179 family)
METSQSKILASDKRKRILETAKLWALLNLGILMLAVGIYFFKAPNGFATGGVSGISIVLARLFANISQATCMLVINVLLLIIGSIILGKTCGLLTVYCSVILSLENLLFEKLIPLTAPLTVHPLPKTAVLRQSGERSHA